MSRLTTTKFAIIGAGAGGICAGIKLLESGRDEFMIFDRQARVGGTWQRNTYPGAACDIASHLYCYTFAPNPDWSRPFAPQPEIREYLERVAFDHGLRDHLRLGVGIESAEWSDTAARWTIELDNGEKVEAQFLISAVGMFGKIAVPDIPGLDTFAGTRFHSAEWNHDHDLEGKRIGVIGSAASAVQFVPEIARDAEQLFVFQRTPNWVLRKEDTPYTPEQLEAFRKQPELLAESRQKIYEIVELGLDYTNPTIMNGAEDLGREALESVDDPELRARLTPDHPFGCKRPLLSNDYLATFNRSNVELVVDAIDHITPSAIATADGKERTVDTIVLATGFETTQYVSAIDVKGRNGVTIGEAWYDGPEAYLGLTVSGFPNLFMLYGPNTNGGNSIILMLEYQVEYMMRLLAEMGDAGMDWIEVRREVMDEFNANLQDDINGVDVWQASCNGYYRSESGRIVTQWPYNFSKYRAYIDHESLDSFDCGRAG